MKISIDTRFADTRAADLSLTHGLDPLPALATHRVALPFATLELRVLGASHQVMLDGWSETVACLPDRALGLPDDAETLAGDYRVRFRAVRRRLRPDEFAREVAGVIADCETDERSLVAEFPGSPLAVTALAARALPSGVSWHTLHAYPQAGEFVHTVSLVIPR